MPVTLPPLPYAVDALEPQHLRDIGAHDPTVLDQIAGRQEGERHRLHERLDGDGIEGAWSDDPADLTWALNGLLARTPSMLACASLDDAVGALMRPNVPGTIDQHPNWRLALPVLLDDLADDPRILAVAEVLAGVR